MHELQQSIGMVSRKSQTTEGGNSISQTTREMDVNFVDTYGPLFMVVLLCAMGAVMLWRSR
jgi:hypothetical protein